jgi:hypothetical protein
VDLVVLVLIKVHSFLEHLSAIAVSSAVAEEEVDTNLA